MNSLLHSFKEINESRTQPFAAASKINDNSCIFFKIAFIIMYKSIHTLLFTVTMNKPVGKELFCLNNKTKIMSDF